MADRDNDLAPRSTPPGSLLEARRGFLWRAHFWTPYATTAEPDGTAGYYKFVRAWTPWGARRLARIYRHTGWTMEVSRA